ncbi:MAG: PPOX class F420-dependent oxidoreductase, partial [Myxococcota bacterium]
MTRGVPLDARSLTTLDRESYINLATYRRNGKAVETPVWFAARRGKIYVFTESRAGKVKRLRNDARIRIAACGIRGNRKGAWIEGSGRRIDDPEIV